MAKCVFPQIELENPLLNRIKKRPISWGIVQKLSWLDFSTFWPHTHPFLTFLKEFHWSYVVKSSHRWHCLYYLPTYSCQCSCWMTSSKICSSFLAKSDLKCWWIERTLRGRRGGTLLGDLKVVMLLDSELLPASFVFFCVPPPPPRRSLPPHRPLHWPPWADMASISLRYSAQQCCHHRWSSSPPLLLCSKARSAFSPVDIESVVGLLGATAKNTV